MSSERIQSGQPVTSCDGCGACCMTQESPPGYLLQLLYGSHFASSPEDLERFSTLPEPLLDELRQYAKLMQEKKRHPNGGMCIWFDENTRRCKHYDLRPKICRECLQPGDDVCLGWREEFADLLQLGNATTADRDKGAC